MTIHPTFERLKAACELLSALRDADANLSTPSLTAAVERARGVAGAAAEGWLAAGTPVEAGETAAKVDQEKLVGGVMRFGIDVSAAQGVIDWAAVKASGRVDFAIIKCSTGNSEVNGVSRDPFFDRNVAGAVANSIPWGAYHFVYPLPTISGDAFRDRDPIAQAQLHFTSRGDVVGDLPDACDAEWPYPQDWAHWGCSAHQIADWLAAYLQKYESLSGRRMIFYTFASWWQAIGGQMLAELAARPLWCAQPVPRSLRPVDGVEPRPWQPFAGWSIWQYSGAAPSFYERVPGIGGDVDGDCATDEGLASLTG